MPPVDGMATYLARGDQDVYAQLARAFLGNGGQVLRVVDHDGPLEAGQVLAYCQELAPLRRILRWRGVAAFKLGEGVITVPGSELAELTAAEPNRLLLPPRAADIGVDSGEKPGREMQVFLGRVTARLSDTCGDAARLNADVAYQRAHRNLLRNRPQAAYQGFRQACESCPSCDCLRGVALARAREGAMADARAAMKAHEKCVGTP